MTDKTDIAALTRPVRDRYDWSNAVWRDCDQCGKQHTGTVTAEDGSQICAHCADQLYWSAWQVLAERALEQLEDERQQTQTADRSVAAERLLRKASDKAFNEQLERAEAAEKERDALKSAHGNMVTRCALLRQRTDLPVDRLPAYNALVKAQEEIAAMKAQLANPVAVVEPNDNLTVAEIRGDIPRRKAVRELYEGALVLGQELFAAPQKPVVLLGKGFKRDIIAGMSAPETEWFSRKDVTAAIEAAGGIVKDGE